MTAQPQNTVVHALRLADGRWMPGQSPNPGGRPKAIGPVRDLARAHTALAVDTLVEICQHGENEMARIVAANAILDRGWGKPMAMVAMHNPGPDLGALIEDAHRSAAEVMAAPVSIEVTESNNGAVG
jgi:hypothetical protein